VGPEGTAAGAIAGGTEGAIKGLAEHGAKVAMRGAKHPKRAKKELVHHGKVAKAVVKAGARVANPKNQAKMVKNLAKGKGLVFPGSNYIGPGNPMNRKVKSKGDALAKKHDEEYDRILKSGVSKKRLYFGYSDADKRLQKASDVTTPEGVATYMGMKGKQLLHKTGLTGKRITDAEVKKREAKKSAGMKVMAPHLTKKYVKKIGPLVKTDKSIG
jgi:hypothetical protein